jgi:tetratricopeptide (TPR) repeat protein
MGERLVGDESVDLFDARAGLAMASYIQGKLPDAESLLRKSLAVAQKRYGPDHHYAADEMLMLVVVLEQENKFDEAERLARQCLAIHRKTLGPGHPHFDQALQLMAALLNNEGKTKEAADAYRELLDVRRKQSGDDHARVAEIVTALARIFIHSHDDVQFEQLARQFPEAWGTRAEELARHGRWSEALAAGSKLVELRPDDHGGYHIIAPLLVQMGDRSAYEELCAKITTHFAGTTDPYTADRMAKDCLILPRPGADMKVPGELAEKAVTLGEKNAGDLPFFQCCKALAEYRQGHFEGAVKWAHLASANPFPYSQAEAFAILSMGQYKLSQVDAARINLLNSENVVLTQLPGPGAQDLGGDWRDWIIAHSLLTEAQNLLGTPAARLDSSHPTNK